MRTIPAVVVVVYIGLLACADAQAGVASGETVNKAALGKPLTLAANEPAGAGAAVAQPTGEAAPVTLSATSEEEKPEEATHPSAQASTEALAKAAQNPVANMISVPLQNNMNFGVGPKAELQNILNIQPVIPISLGPDWNLITRTIMPIVSNPELGPTIGSENGLGDIQFTAFLSPAKAKGFIWGVGPVFQFPSATDTFLGNGKFTVGPSAVALVIKGPWVVGALAQNVWSYAGDSDRKHVNNFLFQPFVNYNFKHGWYVTSSPIMTIDWTADSDNMWTVPVGGGVGKILKIGKLPVNISTQAYYNVATPEFGPDWQLRLQMQFLFPK
jgi:hypothetical protein